MIRIVIADDHPIFRYALRELLSFEEDFEIIGEAADGSEMLQYVLNLEPDILLLDLRMPKLDGLTALQILQQSNKRTKVIVLTASEAKSEFAQAKKLGCSEIVLKHSAPDLIVKAIRMVHSGDVSQDARTGAAAIRQATSAREASPLNRREIEIVQLVAQGLKNKEIADRLFVTEQTVKNYVHTIFCKLRLSDRLELALYAIENDLLMKAIRPEAKSQSC